MALDQEGEHRAHAAQGVGEGEQVRTRLGVISAAWPVRVEATRDQMAALYDAYFNAAQDWATALLTSRRAVTGDLDGLPLDHPYFWDAFNLYGYIPPE